MHIEELHQYCLGKKGVTEELPFGPDTLVFKVVGKVFLLVGLDQINQLSFNVKCDPEYAIGLRQQYEQTVVPGYHMNKKHWNTVYANRELDDEFLKKLIDHSYDLVVKALPKKLKTEVEKSN
ncbi:MmcQ/YjbR family DNA-binding protein [Sphingobacterium olei]|uniref:MmcQ/YjbR family DNA-binding protein n=1 Tax=Sphingobacterium olei TaxID=2571155 RepID=A0A4U0P3Z3_9SPHI|nr:MmcQ/YjbR family DNA-binding protein [Sphingobacterium olei]TJZ62023.1 MmcQ/YjbR family DNA-binding protein [Sphingobacterium olei]